MTPVDITATLTQLAYILLAVWSLTEVIGRRTGWSKDLLAMAIGPLLAIGAFAFGFLSSLPYHSGWKAWGGAAFSGLVATLGASIFHDLLANPIMDRIGLNGPKAP